MKLAYIGIDVLFPALEELERLGCDIIEVCTCETDNITEYNQCIVQFAVDRNIPYQIGCMTETDLRRLEEKGCQLIICGGYYHRIPTDTTIPMVNLHPSMLPHGRGAWPMPHAILNGDATSGFTLHKMSRDFDQGDIILQRSCPIDPRENLQTLTQKLQILAVTLLQEFIPQWETLYDNGVPQGEGDYQPYLQETDFIITPQTSSQEADRILRAFYGYQCIYQGEHCYGLLHGVVDTTHQRAGNLPLVDGSVYGEVVEKL